MKSGDDMAKISKFERKKYLGYTIVVGTILAIYTVSMIFPLLWGVSTSLKTPAGFRKDILWLPQGHIWQWQWSNYGAVFQELYITTSTGKDVFFPQLMLNTTVIAFVNAFIPGWVNIITAYLTVRFKQFKLSKIFINISLIMMLLPIGASLGVSIKFRQALGMYDNLLTNLIPSLSWGGTNFFIYRSLFKGVGETYCEAAEIDGAKEGTIMVRIMIPFVIPMYMAFSIMGFVGAWGDYQYTLVWMPSMPTVGYALFNFTSSTTSTASHITTQMAACIFTMLPVLIVYSIFSDFFMKNLNVGGIKG